MNNSAVCYVDYVLWGGNATLEKIPLIQMHLFGSSYIQAGQKRIIMAPEQIPLTGIPNGESALVLLKHCLLREVGHRGRHVHGLM